MATYILGALLLVGLFFAVRGMVRHFGGGGACCGGGGSSTLRQCGPYSATVNQAIPETTPVSDAALENPFADASGLSKAAVNGVTSRISAAGCGIQHIEHVEVVLTATDDTGARAHPSAGDLQITLTSPAGQTSTLTTPHLCYNISGQQTSCQGLVDFSFGLSRHLEEPAISGTSSDWTLAAADRRTGNTGRLRNWSITLYGR